ncbi:MAG: hypothetical protein EA400_16375 [Chromatiaceae bacterium]|nr:MAG: hypothetical protein EA400_16375 [Chromatiaceae bacterium]
MPAITVKAHYDGRTIQLDEPIELAPNARLLVTVLESTDGNGTDWRSLATEGLARAFGDDEPDYGPEDLLRR